MEEQLSCSMLKSTLLEADDSLRFHENAFAITAAQASL